MTQQGRTEAPRKHQEIGRSRTERPFPGESPDAVVFRLISALTRIDAVTPCCRLADSPSSSRPPPPPSSRIANETGQEARRGHFTPVGSDECHWVVPDTTTATGTPSSNQIIGGLNELWMWLGCVQCHMMWRMLRNSTPLPLRGCATPEPAEVDQICMHCGFDYDSPQR